MIAYMPSHSVLAGRIASGSATRRWSGRLLAAVAPMLTLSLCSLAVAGEPGTTLPRSAIQRPKAPAAAAGAGPVDAVGANPAAANAVAPGAPRQNAAVQRRQPAPEPMDPKLRAILEQWEQVSSKIEAIQGQHRRVVTNPVFSTETHAEGKFYVETPDKGRIDIRGLQVKEGTKPTNAGYKIDPADDERWVCTGQEVIKINDSEKSFEVFPLPPEMQGENIINGPLPFLFGMKVADAERRFRMKLLRDDPKVVWIQAEPLQQMDADNYRRAMIILDREQFLPRAVKLFSQMKVTEDGQVTNEVDDKAYTMYLFDKLVVNHSGLKAWAAKTFGSDPFRPNLKGYTMIQPAELVEKDRSMSAPQVPGAAPKGPGMKPQGVPIQDRAVRPAGAQQK